jgi:uncharacterized damage-inducible protein DinB
MISLIAVIVPGFARPGESDTKDGCMTATSGNISGVVRGGTAMSSSYFTTLSHYNAWANRRLYQACETLSETEYMRERGSFFGSLHATLNHILVADRIWVARIEGRTPPNLKLDQILYGDLIGLKMARVAEDEHIRIMVAGITQERLDLPLEYRDSRGDRLETPLRLVLGHFFNQQAHHRGRAHGLLSQTEVALPPLDLIAFVRQQLAGDVG